MTDERRAAMDRLASAQRAAARLAEYRRGALEDAERAAARLAENRRRDEETEAEACERRASMHAIEGDGDE